MSKVSQQMVFNGNRHTTIPQQGYIPVEKKTVKLRKLQVRYVEAINHRFQIRVVTTGMLIEL